MVFLNSPPYVEVRISPIMPVGEDGHAGLLLGSSTRCPATIGRDDAEVCLRLGAEGEPYVSRSPSREMVISPHEPCGRRDVPEASVFVGSRSRSPPWETVSRCSVT